METTVVIIVIWLLCAVTSGVIATSKNRPGGMWFTLGLLIGIFAVIMVACMPALPALEPEPRRSEPRDPRRRHPQPQRRLLRPIPPSKLSARSRTLA
jgi:hypothetical protein